MNSADASVFPTYLNMGLGFGVHRQGTMRPANRHNGDAARSRGEDDKTCFAAVVLPHLDDAYALARSYTRNRADAEDVVQEACLRAFRGIGGFAGGNARAWVLSIVRNTALTWLGKNRPAALVMVDDLEGVECAQAIPHDPDAETPETALIAKADRAR